MSIILSVRDLSVEFISGNTTVPAVRNVGFDVHKGKIMAIVGESGSGKSVTALSILGLNPAPPARYTGGHILFNIQEGNTVDLLRTDKRTMQHIRGNDIGMIFQEPMSSLNPVITCGRQVLEALVTHKKLRSEQAKEKVIEWFQKVRLPDPSAIFDRYPHELSGGQKQRVMIAMAMCCDPSLLICDEPTTALDVTVQKAVLDLIKELQARTGMGVIFITHDLGVVNEIAHDACVMYKGEIVETGTVEQILHSPQHNYTKALIACRPANHKHGTRLPVVSDFLEGVAGALPPQKELPAPSKNILLQVENLSVHFPAHRSFFGKPKSWIAAVDSVSFHVFKGETLGLVGESGCGKTTLGRTLLRLIEPTSGKIIYDGKDLANIPSRDMMAFRKEIQIVFQDPYSSLNPRITIGEAVGEPLLVHGLAANNEERRNKVRELLRQVDLNSDHVNRYPHEFSGGQRQRIVIARALAMNPSFIVCDESVSALDVSVQAQVLNLLNDLKREFGFTVIFISHDLSVVRYISDRMMVMQAGRIVESGPSEEIYQNPKTAYTKNLIDSIPGAMTA